MPSLLALRHKTAPLHRRLHLLPATDDDAVPAQREEIPQQDQCTQSSGSWQHSWACTERLCSGTHWCLHRHFQHLTKPGCCPHMLQSYHHHSSPKEVISILLQWLPSSSTHSYSHEVLWTVSHAAHQVCPPPPPWTPSSLHIGPIASTDDAIATALHPALTHLDKTGTYVRLLFIDFSSAFNTIIPQQLIHKLVQLGLNTSLCNWLLDFLTGRPQAVRVGSNTSSTITLNTGAPQGCVLSPLLFTLLTHDCTPSHNSNRFIKFADDTTVVGLISNRDETNYRSEVSRLAGWCSDNNLSLNVEKTKEIVVDFRRVHTQHAPLTINGATVERVSSTKFLGVHITEDLSWTNNTAGTSQESTTASLLPPQTKKSQSPAPIMCTFYRGHHREHSD